jgi:hypothetical protein
MNAPTTIYIISTLAGLGFLVAGVFVLYGLGWSLIAGAATFFSIAAFIRKGLSSE